jgi:hypothetical protein
MRLLVDTILRIYLLSLKQYFGNFPDLRVKIFENFVSLLKYLSSLHSLN